jgi:hypothetical protein
MARRHLGQIIAGIPIHRSNHAEPAGEQELEAPDQERHT